MPFSPPHHLAPLALLFSLVALPASAQTPPPAPAQPVVSPASATDAPTASTQAEGLRLRPGEEVPYPGGPVPHGARLIEVPRTGLFVTGVVLFGVGWVPGILAGMVTILAGGLVGVSGGGSGSSVVGLGAGMLLPVVGPLFGVGLGLAYADSVPWQFTAFLAADFVVQAAGFALALWAHFNPRHVLRGYVSPMEGAVSWVLLPGAGGSPSGATFAMRF